MKKGRIFYQVILLATPNSSLLYIVHFLADRSDGSYRWLFNRTRSILSPSLLKLENACPAAIALEAHFKDNAGNYDGESSYMGSIAVLGEIKIPIRESIEIEEALLRNMSDYLQETETVITSLSCTLDESSKHPAFLRYDKIIRHFSI